MRDLVVRHGPACAVSGVSLQVPDRALVALVGANGAGKSSTLSAVAGLVRPAAGKVVLDGRDITRAPSHVRVRAGVVLVPEGRAVLARMSVRENLLLAGPDPERVIERFPILGERWRLPAGALSGGEQQMLAVARGLLARPKVLLLDEPSLGLAPLVVAEVFSLVESIRRDDGVAVLLVEQNARRALEMADHAYVMETGRVVLSGPGRELLGDEDVVRAYLGAG